MSGSNVRVVRDVFSAMAVYYSDLCAIHCAERDSVCGTLCRKRQCVRYTVQKECKPSSGSHNTENISNDTHIGTIHVILAKHRLWLPDDGFM
jgi:hypothetical protein